MKPIVQFIKDSLREFRHVVWPTRKQTQGYFIGVIIFIVCFAVYLFLFNSLFSEIIFWLKNGFSFGQSTATGEVVIPEINVKDADIVSNEVQNEIPENITNTGSVMATGATTGSGVSASGTQQK